MTLPFIDRASPLLLVGMCVMYPGAGLIEKIGTDWDWLWIDAQHGDLDFREVVDLIRATHLIGRPGIVRVPACDPGWVGKVLDAGAAGVIIPMVESLEETEAMVQAAKFPPVGNRSFGGRRIVDLMGRRYYDSANRDTVLILQVESNEACARADEFAAMEGVDGLFLGPDDLLIRDGRDVDSAKSHATIGRQLGLVTQACRKYDKLSVCVAASESAMEIAKECGCRMLVGGADASFLAQGSSLAAAKMKQYFAARPAPDASLAESEVY